MAQNRQRTTSRRATQKSSSRAGDSSPANTNARTDGATRVADQIKNLTRFLYLPGGVAKGIEAADAAAQSGNASQNVIEQTQRSKATVRTSRSEEHTSELQ